MAVNLGQRLCDYFLNFGTTHAKLKLFMCVLVFTIVYYCGLTLWDRGTSYSVFKIQLATPPYKSQDRPALDTKQLQSIEPALKGPERFTKRWAIVQETCHLLHLNSSKFTRSLVSLPLSPPVVNVSVSYCQIGKVSSSTWKPIFRQFLNQHGLKSSPQHEDSSSVLRALPHHVNLAFVREPYSRLLSGYVDKFFSPDAVYLDSLSKYIVQNFRYNASQDSCGHDVTFLEFIRYFIHMSKTGLMKNGHFTPMHEHCPFCLWQHAYIGHLETLSEDMPFILRTIHLTYSPDKPFESLALDARAIRGLTEGVFKCMSRDAARRRLWKQYQIRGLIDKLHSFPLPRDQPQGAINLTDFIQAAQLAQARSVDKSVRRQQKREALAEAFSQVPLEDRLEVKRLLALDFQMFGYDPELEEVFPKTPYVQDDTFSYFDLYK